MMLFRAAYTRDGKERFVTFAAQSILDAAIWLGMWERMQKVTTSWLVELGHSKFKHRSR